MHNETPPAAEPVAAETRRDADVGAIPTLLDLVGHSLAAAHQSSMASIAQLNVALAAYRLLQIQRDSLGAGAAADVAEDALRRILNADRTGGGPRVPPTFGAGRRPDDETGDTNDTLDGAGSRGE